MGVGGHEVARGGGGGGALFFQTILCAGQPTAHACDDGMQVQENAAAFVHGHNWPKGASEMAKAHIPMKLKVTRLTRHPAEPAVVCALSLPCLLPVSRLHYFANARNTSSFSPSLPACNR